MKPKSLSDKAPQMYYQSRIGPCTTMLNKVARLCNDAHVYKNLFN